MSVSGHVVHHRGHAYEVRRDVCRASPRSVSLDQLRSVTQKQQRHGHARTRVEHARDELLHVDPARAPPPRPGLVARPPRTARWLFSVDRPLPPRRELVAGCFGGPPARRGRDATRFERNARSIDLAQVRRRAVERARAAGRRARVAVRRPGAALEPVAVTLQRSIGPLRTRHVIATTRCCSRAIPLQTDSRRLRCPGSQHTALGAPRCHLSPPTRCCSRCGRTGATAAASATRRARCSPRRSRRCCRVSSRPPSLPRSQRLVFDCSRRWSPTLFSRRC